MVKTPTVKTPIANMLQIQWIDALDVQPRSESVSSCESSNGAENRQSMKLIESRTESVVKVKTYRTRKDQWAPKMMQTGQGSTAFQALGGHLHEDQAPR